MKKILLLLACGCLTIAVNAQSLGVRIGLNWSFSDVKYNEETLKTKPNFNLMAGVEYDIPFSLYLSVRTGLHFVQKATEINRGTMYHIDTTYTTMNRFNYLEVPLYLVFRLENGRTGSIFYLGAGPSVAMAIGGSTDVEKKLLSNSSEQWSENVKNVFKKDTDIRNVNYFNRFDFGLGAFVAYKMGSGFTITANYTKGLTNISSHKQEKYSTSYIGVTLGFQM